MNLNYTEQEISTMSLFKCFKRKGSEVVLTVDSNLYVDTPLYGFSWNCVDQNYAELLKEQFNLQLLEYKKGIARDALLYLNHREITQMKRKLKRWDSRKGLWKSR